MDAIGTYEFCLTIAVVSLMTLMLSYLRTNTYHWFKYTDGGLRPYYIITGIITASILGLVTSHFLSIPIEDNVLVNIRNFPILFIGLLLGPYISIPAGIIVGVDRYLMGGATALPCSLAVILAGVMGGVMYLLSNKKFCGILPAVILMLATELMHMSMVIFLSTNGWNIVTTIAPYIIIGSITGMIVCSTVYMKKIERDDAVWMSI